MDQPNFFIVCGLAFLIVFVLLTVLAVAMRAVTLLFPERRSDSDAEVVAAIASSISVISPGARVVRIEEIPCSSSPPQKRYG